MFEVKVSIFCEGSDEPLIEAVHQGFDLSDCKALAKKDAIDFCKMVGISGKKKAEIESLKDDKPYDFDEIEIDLEG